MTSPGTDEPGEQKRQSYWRYLPLLVILAGLAFGYAMGWHQFLSLSYLSESSEALLAMVESYPIIAPLLFFVVYVLATAFSFPAASVLTIFAGFLFGWLQGGLLVAFAATLGATMLFLAARSAFGDALRQRVRGPAARLADGFEENAFGYLLVLRLAPVFPFFVINIAPALFKVPLRTYVTATFIGILPGTFAYAWLGQGVGSVLDAARAAGEEPSVASLVTPEITLAFVFLAVVALIPTMVRTVRGKLARR
jgi:uncharacterized membrane protein YdjX (TVP38/TMEM64 family)